MSRGRKRQKKGRKPGEPLSNLSQENFCKYYVRQDIELYGNGTQAYAQAYILDLVPEGEQPPKINWDSCRAAASRLLTKDNVSARITELNEEGGFNDSNVEKQHTFLINQFSDLKTKKASVELYYKLKGKLVEKHEHEVHNIATVLDEIEAEKNARHKTQKQTIQTGDSVQDQKQEI